MSSQDVRQFNERLARSSRVLLVSHQRPDGDTVSANLAIAHALSDMHKESVSFCVDSPPEALRFLPGICRFTTDASVFRDTSFDAVVVLDSGDLTYAGIDKLLTQNRPCPPVVNIDHHVSNVFFGDVNIVDADAASTTHVLHTLFSQLRFAISKDIATCLLTGLVTDTSNFTNHATTHESMRIASELVLRGGRLQKILTHVNRNKSIPLLKLWGRVFARLKIHPKTGRVTTMVTLKDYEECGVDPESSEGISNFLHILGDVHSILVLKDMGDGYVRGSLRTMRDDVDVGAYAKKLGGGGHAKAAGFQIKGVITETADGWEITQP